VVGTGRHRKILLGPADPGGGHEDHGPAAVPRTFAIRVDPAERGKDHGSTGHADRQADQGVHAVCHEGDDDGGDGYDRQGDGGQSERRVTTLDLDEHERTSAGGKQAEDE